MPNYNYTIREFDQTTGNVVVDFDNNGYCMNFNLVDALAQISASTFTAELLHTIIVSRYPIEFLIAKENAATMTTSTVDLINAQIGVTVDITTQVADQLKQSIIDTLVI